METLELYLHSKGKQSKSEFHLSGSPWCDGFPKLQRSSNQVYFGKAPLFFVPTNRCHLILWHLHCHVSFLQLLLLDLHFSCWCTDSAEGKLFQGWGQFFALFTLLGNLLSMAPAPGLCCPYTTVSSPWTSGEWWSHCFFQQNAPSCVRWGHHKVAKLQGSLLSEQALTLSLGKLHWGSLTCHPRGPNWRGCRNGYCTGEGAEICDHLGTQSIRTGGELGRERSLPTLAAVELRLRTGITPWLALPGSNIPFSGSSDDWLSF